MMKMIAGAILLSAVSTPVLAAEFYIVQDASTKKCTIVDKKPVDTKVTVVSDGKTYVSREEASTAMKTVKVCQSM